MAQTLSSKFIALALATTTLAATGCASMSASPISTPEFDAKDIQAGTDRARKYLKAKSEYVALVTEYAKNTKVNPINYPACDMAAKGGDGTTLIYGAGGGAVGNVLAHAVEGPAGLLTAAGAIVAGLAGKNKEQQNMIKYDFDCDALQAVNIALGGMTYGQPASIHPGGMHRGPAGGYQGERRYYPYGAYGRIPVNPALSGPGNFYQYGSNDPGLTGGFYIPGGETTYSAPPPPAPTCWTDRRLCNK